MAAVASLSKRLLLSRPFHPLPTSLRSFSTPLSDTEHDTKPEPTSRRPIFDRRLENGLDPGVFKAILVGKAGQKPVQKTLKSGRTVVLFSVATGGLRNNRRPLDNEEPREYADRCSVQWHRVCVYPEKLGDLALKFVTPGSILYLEGSLETKVFSDPVTGLVRRIREIALRRDGRIVFLDNTSAPVQSDSELKRVGYY